jgi:putative transposase
VGLRPTKSGENPLLEGRVFDPTAPGLIPALVERQREFPQNNALFSMTHLRLAHIYPKGKALFITWSLHGSLPHARYPPSGKQSAGQAFVWMDRYLDTVRTGPKYLGREDIAGMVVDSIERGAELGHYELHAYVVMPNHVHLLVLPKTPPSEFMRALKGFTARQANRMLDRIGEPFWQAESYDHWVRNAAESERIRSYIENNPVKTGLAAQPDSYLWSSASAGMSPGAAGRIACATPAK